MIIISFLLDGIVSNLVSYQTQCFNPLFTFMSIIIFASINPLKKSVIISIIVGLLYDIVYTDILLFHSFLFCIFSLFSYFIFKNVKNNFYNQLLIFIIFIILFRLMSYLILLLKFSISLHILINSILSSLVLNITYLLIYHWIHKMIKKT